jgi:hypothetical protein
MKNKTEKEKATELVDKMYYARRYKDAEDYIPLEAWEHAKQCALVAVDEIINCDSFFKTLEDTKAFTKYWYEVQYEIEKL